LEEGRPVDLPGDAKLQLLVVFEFLAQEDRGEEADRILVFKGLIYIEQRPGIVGALRPQTQRIAEIFDAACKVDISRIDIVGAAIVADPERIQRVLSVCDGIGIVFIVQFLNAGAEAGLQFCLFAKRVGIIRLDRIEMRCESGTYCLLLRNKGDGRVGFPRIIVGRIQGGQGRVDTKIREVGRPFFTFLIKDVFYARLRPIDIELPVGVGIAQGLSVWMLETSVGLKPPVTWR
jgi:hypothetical protein